MLVPPAKVTNPANQELLGAHPLRHGVTGLLARRQYLSSSIKVALPKLCCALRRNNAVVDTTAWQQQAVYSHALVSSACPGDRS
jgi:hypothetical protein